MLKIIYTFIIRPSTSEESNQPKNNHATDRINECIERIHLHRFSTLENARGKGPSSCGVNLPQDSTDQQTQEQEEENWKQRQPAPSAGEWPRQPAPATRATKRQTPVRRPPPCQEKETSPPSAQTLPDTPRQHITHDRTQKTATIHSSPNITRPPPATSTSPVSPPKKKTRTQSPSAPASRKKNRTRYDSYDFSYPLHEKYDHQDVFNVKMIISTSRSSDPSVTNAQMKRPT